MRKDVQVTPFLKRFVFDQTALVTTQLAKKFHTIDGTCSLLLCSAIAHSWSVSWCLRNIARIFTEEQELKFFFLCFVDRAL